MDNLRGLLSIKRMDRVLNAWIWIWELCGVKKGLDERIDRGVLQWLANVDKLERGMICQESLCSRDCW